MIKKSNTRYAMRALLFFLFILLITTAACKKANSQTKIEESTGSQDSETDTELSPSEEAEQTSSISETDESTSETFDTTPATNTSLDDFIGTLNYSGYIGDSEIQMKLVVESSKQVTGEYWYTSYNTPITITGVIEHDQLLLYAFISEEADDEQFQIIVGSDLSLKGIWLINDRYEPCYMAQTDGSLKAPVQKPSMKPSAEISGFSDKWYGVKSEYYVNSTLRLIPLYDNLVYFSLFAINGANSGESQGIATYSNGTLSFKTIGYSGEDVFYNFTKKSSTTIALDSSDYQYNCGASVSFEAEYNQDASSIIPPDNISFLTEEENTALKKITGEYYENYIQVAQGFDDTLENLDAFNGRIMNIGMRGDISAAILVKNTDTNTIMTAIHVFDYETLQVKTLYFSNDTKYPTPPLTILEWIGDEDYEVVK